MRNFLSLSPTNTKVVGVFYQLGESSGMPVVSSPRDWDKVLRLTPNSRHSSKALSNRGTYFPATQLLIVTSAIPVRLDSSLCVVFAHSINCFKVGMDSSGDFILTDIP